MKGEIVPEILVPEIDKELETVYVERPAGIILAGCSDERLITEASAKKIKEDTGLDASGPILRDFGAATGAARISLVEKIAEHGAEAADSFSPDGFITYTGNLISRARKNVDVVFAVHSAAANEQNEISLHLGSGIKLGCAHAANTGAISDLCAHNKRVLEVAKLESMSLFGANRIGKLDDIALANAQFIDTVLGGDADFSVERQDFHDLGTPVMVLAGDHLNPKDTVVVENFSINRIADPQLADNINRKHYTYDMTQLAETIIKCFPEVKFDPVTLLLTMHLDVVATRAALAGGEPTDLQLQRYGDVEQAIAYLESI